MEESLKEHDDLRESTTDARTDDVINAVANCEIREGRDACMQPTRDGGDNAPSRAMVNVARECVTAWVKRWVGVPDQTRIHVLFEQELTLTANVDGVRQQINLREPICQYENITIVPHVDTPLTLITSSIGQHDADAERIREWYETAVRSAKESSRDGADQLLDMVEPMLPRYDRDGVKIPFDFSSLVTIIPQLLDHSHPVRAAIAGQAIKFKPGYVIDERRIYLNGIDSVTRSKIASETTMTVGQLSPKDLLSHPKLMRTLTMLMANVKKRNRQGGHYNDGTRSDDAARVDRGDERNSFW